MSKQLAIQARDALLSACGGRCNAEYNPCDYKEVADALTAAIDTPGPEPEAWLSVDCIGERYLCFSKPDDDDPVAPLYTRPAPRQPLDDETIFQIACGAADEMWPGVGGVGWTKEDAEFFRIFCRKIEAALRAKP